MLCAIGVAASLRRFRDKGFKLVGSDHCNGTTALLKYRTERGYYYHNWDAVERFFDLSRSNAEYLFSAEHYKGRVTPTIVADRIEEYIKLAEAAAQFAAIGSSSTGDSTQLTDHEQDYVLELENLQRLIEIGEQAKREQDQILLLCKHEAFHDEPSFIYDFRICAVCGSMAPSFLK